MACNRTIRHEMLDFARKSTFTIKLPWAGEIFADDDSNKHHPSVQRMKDVRANIAKVKPAIAKSVTTLVFTGAPWKWCQRDTDGPEYGASKNVDNRSYVAFPCIAVYADLCKQVFVNLRHVRFHLDFPFDFRFRYAEFNGLLAVVKIPNVETIHIQFHFDHRWLPKAEAESLEVDRASIEYKLRQDLEGWRKRDRRRDEGTYHTLNGIVLQDQADGNTASSESSIAREVEMKVESIYQRPPPYVETRQIFKDDRPPENSEREGPCRCDGWPCGHPFD